jgi:6-phosphogluconolactonase
MRVCRLFRGVVAAAALLAVFAISGCAGFWDPLPGTGGGGGGTNPASGNFYVLNQSAGQIAGFAFAAGASSPTALNGSPYALGVVPNCIAINPAGSFLYVGTVSGVLLYTINSDGSLTANTGAVTSDVPNAIQVDPSGSWLLEAIPGPLGGRAILSAVPLNSTTGGANGASVPINLPAATVQQIAISPSGSTASYAFVAMGTGGTAVVPFNSGNANPFGTVQSFGVKHAQGASNAIAVDPQYPLLYVGESAAASGTQSGGLRVFTIGTSGVTEITSGTSDVTGTAYPYTTGGTGPSSIVATSAGDVYVSNRAVAGSSNGNITGFKILVSTSGNTYTLAAINTVTTGPQTTGLAVDSTSAYLLAVNFGGGPDLSTFTFDATTAGQLDAGPTAATGTDPVGAIAIAAAP